jgi:hypothetical protein
MIASYRFMISMVDLGQLIAPGIVEQQRHIVRECAVIFLQRSAIIGTLFGDHLGDLLLTPHRIHGDCRPSSVQHLQ